MGGFPGVSEVKVFVCNSGIPGSNPQLVKNLPATQEIQVQILGWKDALEKEMAKSLQYSCLENPMDREAWQVTVHGVTKSWTQLSN